MKLLQEPNSHTVQQFFRTLFGGYGDAPGLYIELRALPVEGRITYEKRRNNEISPVPISKREEQGNEISTKKGTKKALMRRFFPLQAQSMPHLVKAVQWLSESHDVYFGVLPRRCGSGKAQDVVSACVLWADIDGGEETPAECLTLLKERVRNAVLPTPDMVVCSGGGLHVYYLLKECYPLTTEAERRRFKDVLKRLSFAIGGKAPQAHSDSSCADVARVLRVAGTWNRKQPENPRRVEVWHEVPEPEFTFLEWEDGLPQLPTANRAKPHASPVAPTDYDLYRNLWIWANKPIPEGERHKRLTSGAAWLLRDLKLPRSIVEELLRRKAEVSAGRNPIPERELEAILKWA